MHLHAVLPSEIIDLKNIPQFYYASPCRTPLRNHLLWLEDTPILHLHAVLPSEIIDFKYIPQFFYASPRRTPLRNHWLEEYTPILLCISTPYSPQKSLILRTYPNSTMHLMHLHAVLPSEIIDLKNIPQFYYASPRRTPLRNHWLEEHTPILLCISTPYSPQKSLTWRTYPNSIMHLHAVLPSEIIDLKNIPIELSTYPNSIMHLHAVLPSEIIDLKNIPQFYYASPRRTPLRNHWF